ncbi:DUF2335 domain-containing protein [Prevotella koreensis]|uniref:DUF2335 domain-containing protein n=1 Tax=Prevotella koreensis TaxID=2490854 RepID=A0A432LIX3_9BACT|nr:DUF2335 domain-containing protein [Prevotella koreensis]RUL59114.1 DUF2335 domain-containing protein [Prevotella koreensis]
MGKKQISNKETKVATQGGIGQQYEQTVTVDDNTLPSPQELAEYKTIDPRIVDYLLDAAKEEQRHRHKIEEDKVKTVKNAERRTTRMNWWGMFFAFLALVALIVLSAFALYLNHPWFAGIFSFATAVSILSIFVDGGKKKK